MKKFNIHTLTGITNPLGELGCDLSETIYQHRSRIEKLLEQNDELQGLGNLVEREKINPLFRFEEADKLYNSNITHEEKQAWVWWKQSIGIPMFGWEKYYLQKSKGSISDMVYSVKSGKLRDNHFREISEFAANQFIGKFLRYSEHGEKGTFIICRNQEGIVIVEKNACRIEKSSNDVSPEKLKALVKAKALLFCEGELLPYAVYAYGNMYDRQQSLAKDRETIIDNFGQEIYEFHYNVCHKTQNKENPYGAIPAMKSVTNPDQNERPFISPISSFATDIQEFSVKEVREEYMNIEESDETTMVNGEVRMKKKKERIDLVFDGERKYDLQTVFIKWLFSLNETDFNECNAAQIVDYYLVNKALRDDKKNPEEKAVLKSFARNEGDILFQRFLHEVLTFETQQKLDFTWNRIYNGQSALRYDKIPIAFEISRLFKTGILQLTPMQREVLGFSELSGNAIFSLDVGGGKTICMIISMAMGLQQGKFKRPLLIIPKPVYPQFVREMQGYTDKKTKQFVYGVLSGTDIKYNEWFNLGTSTEKKLGNEFTKQVAKNTITVITKEGIKKLGFTDKAIDESLIDLIEIFESKTKDDDPRADARGEAKKEQKIYQMIGIAQKGSIADFDALGFDAIYADEAHAYKNIFTGVKPDKYDAVKRYDLTGVSSDFGLRFFFLAHFVQRKYGRNIVLATATPFQKAILEIYSMLSLVSFNELKRKNILNIKRFCDLFIKREMEYVANFKEELVLKEVIKNFVNADILRGLINSVIYYRSKENFTNVQLPCKINLPLINTRENGVVRRLHPSEQVVTYLKMSKQQRENQTRIIQDIRAAYAMKAKTEFDKAMKKLAIFRGISQAQKNAFSPFEIDGKYSGYKDFVEGSPKIHAACLAVQSVKDYAKNTRQNMPGQIIYSNRGTIYFKMIKEFLDKEIGFKTNIRFERSTVDEVEIITSSTTQAFKDVIQNAFNEGICKVIIGTSTIQEGLNLQRSATDIHVINTEWNPTALVQLAGRIHRQGNPYGYIRFTIYLLQDSVDVPMFQKNEEKIARINELLEKNGQKVIDGDTIDANEIKYSLITDINLIVKMDFDKEVEEQNKILKKQLFNINLIDTISTDIEDYRFYKNDLISTISRIPGNYYFNSYFNTNVEAIEQLYAGKTITKADYDKRKRNFEKISQIREQISRINEIQDKELISLCKMLINFQKANNFNAGSYSVGYDPKTNVPFYVRFSELVSKIAKTEKTVLRPKGYDRNSDFTIVLAEMQKEYETALANYISLYGEESQRESDSEFYKTTKAYEIIHAKVQAIKNNLDIAGKSPEEMVKDFSKLNHLIDFTIHNRPCGDQCCIPDKDAKPANRRAIPETKKRIPELLLKELELI